MGVELEASAKAKAEKENKWFERHRYGDIP